MLPGNQSVAAGGPAAPTLRPATPDVPACSVSSTSTSTVTNSQSFHRLSTSGHSDGTVNVPHLRTSSAHRITANGKHLHRTNSNAANSHIVLPVDQWAQEHVQQWLEAVRLPQLVEPFKVMGIDGRALCGLLRLSKAGTCLRELVKCDLGITHVGTMFSFVEEFMKLLG